MSRATRIVRFTFWMNNLVFLFLAFSYIFGFVINRMQSMIFTLFFMGAIVIIYSFQNWYLKNRLGVKSLKDIFCFIDDEREKDIDMRVASQLVKTSSLLMIMLFILTCFLTNMYAINVRSFGIVMILAITIAMIYMNIKYYVLWNKFSNE